MKLIIPITDTVDLRNERGERGIVGIRTPDGEVLSVVGGVTLGQPVALRADGEPAEEGDTITAYAFEHDFPEDAIAMLKSRAATRAVAGVTDPKDLDDADFSVWAPGLAVAIGDVLTHENVAYEVIQAHTTQSDWAPPVVPALFKVFRQVGGGTEPWVSGASYAVGERVTYQGSTYECRQAHTSQAGWTPTAVPALWLLIP